LRTEPIPESHLEEVEIDPLILPARDGESLDAKFDPIVHIQKTPVVAEGEEEEEEDEGPAGSDDGEV